MSNDCPNDPRGKHNYIITRSVKKGKKTINFLQCINCSKDIMEIVEDRR